MNDMHGAFDAGYGSVPAPVPAARRSGFRFRFSDFELREGRVYLPKNGNYANLDRALAREVTGWVGFIVVVWLKGLIHRAAGRRGPAIWFAPDVPHPRYLVRSAAMWSGMMVARSPARADAAFFFEDATISVAHEPVHGHHFNFGCTDISKSRVAAVFEDVFGYPLAIDPARWSGEAVEKSEVNGVHDGHVVHCPRPALPGHTYQKLVDTIRDDGFAYDLRTHCVGGQVVAVWVKRRSPKARFLPPNLAVVRHDPEAVFSAAELGCIGAFARAMGADWCALDILRDEPTGRIYVVDVNKTDAGPITALSFREKLASTALLARSLRAMVERGAGPQADGS